MVIGAIRVLEIASATPPNALLAPESLQAPEADGGARHRVGWPGASTVERRPDPSRVPLDPMTRQADIRSYYDSYSTWYDDERRTGYYELINHLEAELVIESAADRDILEIGVGTGLILERTSKVARSAHGLDLSHGMASFSNREKGLSTLQATADVLPFPDHSFDVVYSMKVLPHVPLIADAVAEIHRVLRPGGKAYLEFYNPRSLKFLANRLGEVLRRKRAVYIRYDTPKTIDQLVQGHFTVEGYRGVRILAPSRHFYTMPVLGPLVRRMERAVCDKPFMSRLGGYLIAELQRIDG